MDPWPGPPGWEHNYPNYITDYTGAECTVNGANQPAVFFYDWHLMGRAVPFIPGKQYRVTMKYCSFRDANVHFYLGGGKDTTIEISTTMEPGSISFTFTGTTEDRLYIFNYGEQFALSNLQIQQLCPTLPSMSTTAYRYRYNGKEQLSSFSGRYDYGFRMYDAGVGRFLSVDPLTKKYPWYSPFQFAGNKPINSIDVDGLEEFIAQYRFNNGKTTLISIMDNKQIDLWTYIKYDLKPSGPDPFGPMKGVKNAATGLPMGRLELGTIQYQYFDGSGKRLKIRRDYDGSFVSGNNEHMNVYKSNWFGSIYIGPNNPEYSDEKGDKRPDYRREAQDQIDEAALEHDRSYDDAGAKGIAGALFNKKVFPADLNLWLDAAKVSTSLGGTLDTKTGKPYTSNTKERAAKVSSAFKRIVNFKSIKP